MGPFQFFRHYEIFFLKTFLFHQRAPLQFFDVLQQWMLKNAKGPPFSAPKAANSSNFLGFSGTVEENTLTL